MNTHPAWSIHTPATSCSRGQLPCILTCAHPLNDVCTGGGGGVAIECKSRSGLTALILAGQEGHTETVELLLERRADVNAEGVGGITALTQALKNKHIPLATLLVTRGTPPPLLPPNFHQLNPQPTFLLKRIELSAAEHGRTLPHH